MALFPKAGEELDRLKKVEPKIRSYKDTGRIYWYLDIAGVSCSIDTAKVAELIKSGVRQIND